MSEPVLFSKNIFGGTLSAFIGARDRYVGFGDRPFLGKLAISTVLMFSGIPLALLALIEGVIRMVAGIFVWLASSSNAETGIYNKFFKGALSQGALSLVNGAKAVCLSWRLGTRIEGVRRLISAERKPLPAAVYPLPIPGAVPRVPASERRHVSFVEPPQIAPVVPEPVVPQEEPEQPREDRSRHSAITGLLQSAADITLPPLTIVETPPSAALPQLAAPEPPPLVLPLPGILIVPETDSLQDRVNHEVELGLNDIRAVQEEITGVRREIASGSENEALSARLSDLYNALNQVKKQITASYRTLVERELWGERLWRLIAPHKVRAPMDTEKMGRFTTETNRSRVFRELYENFESVKDNSMKMRPFPREREEKDNAYKQRLLRKLEEVSLEEIAYMKDALTEALITKEVVVEERWKESYLRLFGANSQEEFLGRLEQFFTGLLGNGRGPVETKVLTYKVLEGIAATEGIDPYIKARIERALVCLKPMGYELSLMLKLATQVIGLLQSAPTTTLDMWLEAIFFRVSQGVNFRAKIPFSEEIMRGMARTQQYQDIAFFGLAAMIDTREKDFNQMLPLILEEMGCLRESEAYLGFEGQLKAIFQTAQELRPYLEKEKTQLIPQVSESTGEQDYENRIHRLFVKKLHDNNINIKAVCTNVATLLDVSSVFQDMMIARIERRGNSLPV